MTDWKKRGETDWQKTAVGQVLRAGGVDLRLERGGPGVFYAWMDLPSWSLEKIGAGGWESARDQAMQRLRDVLQQALDAVDLAMEHEREGRVAAVQEV